MTSVKNVASIAGVSTATVSRALNSPEKVTPVTRQKVLAAAAEAGYTGNHLARNLRTNKSSQIIVLVPNIANPFFSEVIRGIERVAHEYGYSVLLGNTQDDRERENRYSMMLAAKQADGLITLCPRLPALGRKYSDAEMLAAPIVNACECAPDMPMRTVQLDNGGAAQKATEFLLDLGHKRIGFVAGPSESPLTKLRFEGYATALNNAGLETIGDLYVSGDYSVRSGMAAVEQLTSVGRAPTAVFCCNDEMALGVITELKRRDVSIPDDVSVVGFDDIKFAQFFDPPLTTIAQPMGELGECAMQILCDIFQGRSPKAKDIVLPFELVVRGSTARNSKS